MEKVFRWQALIDSGKFSNVHELARVIGKDDGYVSLIIRLAAGEILPLFLFSIQKSAFRSKRKSEPFWRIILRAYYGGVFLYYFGRKVLYDLVYYQLVMTFLENKKEKDFWSLK